MPKRVPIFGTGKHRGKTKKEFTEFELKEIVENTKQPFDIQYIHTSHWNKKSEKDGVEYEAPQLGQFNNLHVEDGKIYAEPILNDVGLEYEEKGMFNGISVEMMGNAIVRAAALPTGVTQAFDFAEFEANEDYSEIMEYKIEEYEEYEEVKKVTLQEILDALGVLPLEDRLSIVEAVGKSITSSQKSSFRAIQWEFEAGNEEALIKEMAEFAGVEIEIKEKEKQLTQSEMRELVRKEMEIEFQAKEDKLLKANKVEKFKESIKGKVMPFEFEMFVNMYAESLDSEKVIEFEADEKITMSEKLEKYFEQKKPVIEFEEKTPKVDENETDKWVEDAKKAGEQA